MLTLVAGRVAGHLEGIAAKPWQPFVVLNDMQEPFVKKLTDRTRDKLAAAQKSLLRSCATADIPLAVVLYEGKGDVVPDLQELILRVPRQRTIIKHGTNGFERPLMDTLEEVGATMVVFSGLFAECCVWETAKSVMLAGYEVFAPEHLIADASNDELTAARRNWYRRNGCFRPLPQLLAT